MAKFSGDPYVADELVGKSSNDSLYGDSGDDTLIGGKGNDTYTGGADSDTFVFAKDEGNDVITDYEEEDVIKFTSGKPSFKEKGSDVVITLGKGNITLKGAVGKIISYIDKDGNEKTWPNDIIIDSPKITLTAGYAKKDFDLTDYANELQTIDASAVTHDLSIKGNAKANVIIANDQDNAIDGGAGSDKIYAYEGNDTLTGGKGADTLDGGAGADVFVYNAGDGNDVIKNYANEDMISIGSGKIANVVVSGNDYILTIAKGKTTGNITLEGAADKYIHYVDESGNEDWIPEPPPNPVEISKNTKSITLTSGFEDDVMDVKTHAEVSHYKSKVVSIDASQVSHGIKITANANANAIIGSEEDDVIDGLDGADTIEGGGGNDTIIGGKGNDILDGGSGADMFVYNVGDGNDIIKNYNNEDVINLNSGTVTSAVIAGGDYIFTISKGKTTGKITVEGGAGKYIHFIDADDNETWYPDPPPSPVEVSKKGTSITLTSGYIEDNFDVKTHTEISTYKNTIVSIDASQVTHDISISANKNANVIIGSEENDYIDGGEGKDSINGGDGNDTIVGGKGNDILDGGDGADVFIYNVGDGNDVIQNYANEDIISLGSGAVKSAVVSKDGKDYIFTIGQGKTTGNITVKGAGDKYIHFVDTNGEDVWYPDPPPYPIDIAKNGKGITLTEGFTDESIDVKNYEGLSSFKNTIVTIDASQVTHDVAITGNKNANNIVGSKEDDLIDGGDGSDTINSGDGNDSIIGGKGNDVLYGGDGADIFIYNSGDGNDKIMDYSEEDVIKFVGVKATATTIKGSNDVVFTAGSNKLTVKGGKDHVITYVDSDGRKIYPEDVLKINDEGNAVTLLKNYRATSFDVNTNAQVEQYADIIETIDGASVTHKIEITGNGNNNSISGGKSADTLYGGSGNDKDTLTGGAGADVFIYGKGDGKDVITDYNAKEGDVVKITSGTATINTVGSDVVFTFDKNNTLTLKGAKNSNVTYIDADGNTQSYPQVMYTIAGGEDGDEVDLILTKYYYEKEFILTDHDSLSAVDNINAKRVEGDLVIKGDRKDNVITGSAGDNTIYGGAGNDTLYGGYGKNTYVYRSGDGNDLIMGYGEGDTLLIDSGELSGKVKVKDNTVIFTVGKGKISLEGAAGKRITTYYDDETETKIYSSSSFLGEDDSSWFLADDNDFAGASEDLTTLVKSNAADTAVAETAEDALSFTKKDNALPVASYTKKK